MILRRDHRLAVRLLVVRLLIAVVRLLRRHGSGAGVRRCLRRAVSGRSVIAGRRLAGSRRRTRRLRVGSGGSRGGGRSLGLGLSRGSLRCSRRRNRLSRRVRNPLGLGFGSLGGLGRSRRRSRRRSLGSILRRRIRRCVARRLFLILGPGIARDDRHILDHDGFHFACRLVDDHGCNRLLFNVACIVGRRRGKLRLRGFQFLLSGFELRFSSGNLVRCAIQRFVGGHDGPTSHSTNCVDVLYRHSSARRRIQGGFVTIPSTTFSIS